MCTRANNWTRFQMKTGRFFLHKELIGESSEKTTRESTLAKHNKIWIMDARAHSTFRERFFIELRKQKTFVFDAHRFYTCTTRTHTWMWSICDAWLWQRSVGTCSENGRKPKKTHKRMRQNHILFHDFVFRLMILLFTYSYTISSSFGRFLLRFSTFLFSHSFSFGFSSFLWPSVSFSVGRVRRKYIHSGNVERSTFGKSNSQRTCKKSERKN